MESLPNPHRGGGIIREAVELTNQLVKASKDNLISLHQNGVAPSVNHKLRSSLPNGLDQDK